jgi:hypothetical protein
LFGAVFLGRDILLLHRPAYTEAAPTLYVLALSHRIGGLTSIFGSIVGGREDVDKRVDVSFRDYLRSWLFRYNIAGLLLGIAYVTAFSIVTYVARTGGLEPADTAYVWSYAHLGLSIASLAMSYLFSRRKFVFRVPWKSIIRYLLAAALMLGLMYPLYLYIPASNTAVVQFVRVASMLTIGRNSYILRVGYLIRLRRGGK